jgi:hypothetical protein
MVRCLTQYLCGQNLQLVLCPTYADGGKEVELMERGMLVWARVYPKGERLLRVWMDVGSGVLLTTEAEYGAALFGQHEPVVVGFPKSDVRQVEPASIS